MSVAAVTGHPPYPRSAVPTLSLLSAAEEDPCACESIVRFEAKVEDLLQALTRKYILAQTVDSRGREDRRSIGGQGAGGMATDSLVLDRGLGQPSSARAWILARKAGTGLVMGLVKLRGSRMAGKLR